MSVFKRRRFPANAQISPASAGGQLKLHAGVGSTRSALALTSCLQCPDLAQTPHRSRIQRRGGEPALAVGGKQCPAMSSSSDRSWLRRTVRSSRGLSPDARRLAAQQRASPFLSRQIAQRHIVEHGVGQHLLELVVLVFQSPELLVLQHVHAAELGFPL